MRSLIQGFGLWELRELGVRALGGAWGHRRATQDQCGCAVWTVRRLRDDGGVHYGYVADEGAYVFGEKVPPMGSSAKVESVISTWLTL
jgi:hypothetical protein